MKKEIYNDEHVLIAESCEATHNDVAYVLAQPITPEGRSEFKWVRLANGDLILGVYPRGDTYISASDNLEI